MEIRFMDPAILTDPAVVSVALFMAAMSVWSGNLNSSILDVSRSNANGLFTVTFNNYANRITFETGYELRATYAFDQYWWGRFNPVVDVSYNTDGGIFAGAGFYQQFELDTLLGDMFLGFTFAPGYYVESSAPEMGSVSLRTTLEAGIRLQDNWQTSISFDHRSNGHLTENNYILDGIQLRISKQFN